MVGGREQDSQQEYKIPKSLPSSLDNCPAGIAPKVAKSGDVIAVIAGLYVSFILRRAADESFYQVVGLCNIHGIMRGELEDPDTDGGWEKISLI